MIANPIYDTVFKYMMEDNAVAKLVVSSIIGEQVVEFDQENLTSDHHILNVSEEDFPEKYRPIIRRLKMAASDPYVKRQMKKEDEDIKYLQDIERGGYHKGITEGRAENEAERVKLTEALAQKDADLKAALARIAQLEKSKK